MLYIIERREFCCFTLFTWSTAYWLFYHQCIIMLPVSFSIIVLLNTFHFYCWPVICEIFAFYLEIFCSTAKWVWFCLYSVATVWPLQMEACKQLLGQILFLCYVDITARVALRLSHDCRLLLDKLVQQPCACACRSIWCTVVFSQKKVALKCSQILKVQWALLCWV